MTSSRSGKRPADWAEFYKNGPPQEVIIINDDTPPPYASSSASSSVSSSHHNQHQVPSHHYHPTSHDRTQQHYSQHSSNSSNTIHRHRQQHHHQKQQQDYDYHGSSPRSHGIIAPPPRSSDPLHHPGHGENNNNNLSQHDRLYSPESHLYQDNGTHTGNGSGRQHIPNISSAAPVSSSLYMPSNGTARVARRSSKRQHSADQHPYGPSNIPEYIYNGQQYTQELPHHPQHHHHHHHPEQPPQEPVYQHDPRDFGYPVAPYSSGHHTVVDPYRDVTPTNGYPIGPNSGSSPLPKKRRTVNVPLKYGVPDPLDPLPQRDQDIIRPAPYSSGLRYPHREESPVYDGYPTSDSVSLKRKMKSQDLEWNAKQRPSNKYRVPPAPLSESHHNGVPYYHSQQLPPPQQPLPPPLPQQVHVAPTPVSRASAPIIPPWDDKEGHYIVTPHEDLTPRYKIIRLLGQGTFGKVVECYDRETGRYCAIKVIRAVQKYRDASKIEARVLNTLKKSDPKNSYNCLHLNDIFDFRNHVCMVFDLLGQSIYDWLKDNSFCPFPPNHIQLFARQLLTSVAFLHRLRLIHTDLKPENILLANGAFKSVSYKTTVKGPYKTKKVLLNPDIRLIDFGSATFQDEHHSTVVSTRHYRAPEIILGLGWSYPCDIWSIGCILVELLTGEALFQTHDNLEHLAMMQAVLGHIPDKLIRASNKTAQKFFVNGRLHYPNDETKRNSRKFVKALRPLRNYVVPAGSSQDQQNFAAEFMDLLTRLLAYDPSERITAAQALRHPYFNYLVDEQGQILNVRRTYAQAQYPRH
ncbi:dual-specificity kinase [Entomortierella parvispora]|uniref:Dual-specificity kinase n=1 Tax=Entomortierella parvispora TaxID=205924 RepID=A0A9P3HEN4_9FUNG|nr:dual-specificity kinase [Entomortierella parvispora]